MSWILQFVLREFKLLARQRAEWVNPLLFFALIAMLFPLTVNPQPAILQSMAVGVIWVSGLLACLLLMLNVFADDFTNGWLAHVWVSRHSLLAYVWLKLAVRWLFFTVPILLMVPLIALTYGLPAACLKPLLVSLLLGLPSMILLAGLISSMALAAKHNSVLMAIVLFPMYVPIVVFGAGMVGLSGSHQFVVTPLLILIAILMAGMSVIPAVIAWLLRLNIAFQ